MIDNNSKFEFYLESFRNFLEFQKKYSKYTIKSYTRDLIHFKQFFFSKGAKVVSTNILQSWILLLIEQKYKNNTINRKLSSIKTFYAFLQKKYTLFEDLPICFNFLKTKNRLPSFLKEKEVSQIFHNLDTNNHSFINLRDILVIDLLYGTGIRLTELINLKISDINFFKKQILVHGKRNKQRLIPVPKATFENILNYIQARNKLANIKDNEFLILTKKSKKSYPMLIQRIVSKLSKYNNNFNNITPHSLRHTYATHMLDNGSDIKSLKDLLGHSSLASTQIYTHTSIKRLSKILKKTHPRG